jgi:flavin-dependent dehydrogenase
MCDGSARQHFARFVARVSERWHIPAAAISDEAVAPRTKMLPLAPIDRTYGDRVLAVGDAAGLVKATTGGGIYYSLTSARIAADVLAAALRSDDLSDSTLAAYEQRWRAALGDELDAQMSLRTVANQLSDSEIDALFELARTDGVMPIVRRTATFNRHRTLILSLLSHPPARRIFLRRALGWGVS